MPACDTSASGRTVCVGKPCTDHLGNEFPSESAMCKFWGINHLTFRHRVHRGWDLGRALAEPAVRKANPVTDHLGNEFPSESAMCKFWGIFLYTYKGRRKSGMSVKEALTTPVAAQSTNPGSKLVVVDHEGIKYPTKAAMCRHWRVGSDTFDRRISAGWSVEEALTTPAEGDGSRRGARGVSVTDHLGNEFPSKAAMCRHWGLKPATFNSRRAAGWDIKSALTVDNGWSHASARSKPCVDHEGNEYPSEAAMCRAWGVGFNTYHYRREHGWTVEQALTGDEGRSHVCTDHLGNTYPSVNAMCERWGVGAMTYRTRVRKGWDLERALTEPTHVHNKPCVDHEGNEYPSKSAMCRAWGVDKSTYASRRQKGWTLEEALTGAR